MQRLHVFPRRVSEAHTVKAEHAALRVHRVHKAYGDVQALRDVSLEVRHGELFVLLGRNGAGKTTLFAILYGLLRADGGEVRVCGRPVKGPRSVRDSIGFAQQEIGLYERLTTLQNLNFFAQLRGLRSDEARDAVEDIVAELALGPFVGRTVERLSTGERRRVHVAGALVGRPPVVILDEPTAGVDVDTRSLVVEVVGRRAAAGAAVCYSTHYLSEVRAMANPTVAVLESGNVVECSSAAELVARFGRSGIELTFVDGFDVAAVTNRLPEMEVEGARAWLGAPRPETLVAEVLSTLGEARAALQSVRVVEAGIETAFHALTGRRME